MTKAAARPTLFLIAGPNGAGKTTFYRTVLEPRVAAPFINADLIQRDELADPDVGAAYRAAEIATERREAFLDEGVSFVTETVFSHPSKLELLQSARARGYRLVVFHLGLASADLAVARVSARTQEGGHPVPEEKIRSRYERSSPLIRSAILMADHGSVFDASQLNQAPILLLRTASGRAEKMVEEGPNWFRDLYGHLRSSE